MIKMIIEAGIAKFNEAIYVINGTVLVDEGVGFNWFTIELWSSV